MMKSNSASRKLWEESTRRFRKRLYESSAGAGDTLDDLDELVDQFSKDFRQARRRKGSIIEHLMAATCAYRLSDSGDERVGMGVHGYQLRGLEKRLNGMAEIIEKINVSPLAGPATHLGAEMMAIPYPNQTELGIGRRKLSASAKRRIGVRLRPQSERLAELESRCESFFDLPNRMRECASFLGALPSKDLQADHEVHLCRRLRDFTGGRPRHRTAGILLAACYRLAGRNVYRSFGRAALKARERRLRVKRPLVDLRLITDISVVGTL